MTQKYPKSLRRQQCRNREENRKFEEAVQDWRPREEAQGEQSPKTTTFVTRDKVKPSTASVDKGREKGGEDRTQRLLGCIKPGLLLSPSLL